MKLALRGLSSCAEISNHALREWCEPRSRTSRTRMYLGVVGDEEVAYVAVDVVPEWGYLVLYELYVLPQHRKRGYGTAFLSEIEQVARGLGFDRVALKPKPIDESWTKEDLVRWYQRHGYSWQGEDRDFVFKTV